MITIILREDLGGQPWPNTADNDPTMSLLLWVSTLLSILGIGLIKLSVAFTVLKLAPHNWHRHAILGLICMFDLQLHSTTTDFGGLDYRSHSTLVWIRTVVRRPYYCQLELYQRSKNYMGTPWLCQQCTGRDHSHFGCTTSSSYIFDLTSWSSGKTRFTCDLFIHNCSCGCRNRTELLAAQYLAEPRHEQPIVIDHALVIYRAYLRHADRLSIHIAALGFFD